MPFLIKKVTFTPYIHFLCYPDPPFYWSFLLQHRYIKCFSLGKTRNLSQRCRHLHCTIFHGNFQHICTWELQTVGQRICMKCSSTIMGPILQSSYWQESKCIEALCTSSKENFSQRHTVLYSEKIILLGDCTFASTWVVTNTNKALTVACCPSCCLVTNQRCSSSCFGSR